MTNALGQVTRLGDYDERGKPGSITDANGVTSSLAYTGVDGWLASVSTAGSTTRFDYDAVGQITRVTRGDGSWLSYEYDDARRLVAIGNNLGERLEYDVDTKGNRTAQRIKDASGSLVRQQQWAYDELGRLLRAVGAGGQTRSFAYDLNDNPVGETNPRQFAHSQAFDASTGWSARAIPSAARPDSPTTPRTTSPRSGPARCHHPLRIRRPRQPDPTGQPGQRHHHLRARRRRQRHPPHRRSRYGHRVSLRRPQSPDRAPLAERPGASTYSTATTSPPTATRASAAWAPSKVPATAGVPLRRAQPGRAGTQHPRPADPARPRDLPLRRGQPTAGDRLPLRLAIGYPRNAGGQVASVTLAVATRRRAPGRADRLPALRPAAAPDLGQRHHSQPRVRPGLPTAAAEGPPAERLPARCQWQYPAAPPQPLGHPGLPVRPAGPPDRGTRRPGRAQLRAYDAVGNRTQRSDNPASGGTASSQDYQYSPDSNRLTAIGAQAVTSDAAGNLTQDRAARNWPTTPRAACKASAATASRSPNTATTPSANASSSSPPRASPPTSRSRRPVARRSRNTTAAAGNCEPSITCGWTACRWPPSTPTTTPRARSATRPLLYLHGDHLDTPRLATDASGQIAWQWQSDAFGRGEALSQGSTQVNLRFPGQYYDAESGLHYNYFRDYDPETGRYVESDPIGLVGGLNTYGYVEGNPLGLSDPLGLAPGDMFATEAAARADALAYQESVNSSIDRWLWGIWSMASVCLKPPIAFGPTKYRPQSWELRLHLAPKVLGKSTSQEFQERQELKTFQAGQRDRPYQGESGKDFAKRIMDQKYGKGNWKDGPGSEYNQIKKWGDRSFIDPK